MKGIYPIGFFYDTRTVRYTTFSFRHNLCTTSIFHSTRFESKYEFLFLRWLLLVAFIKGMGFGNRELKVEGIHGSFKLRSFIHHSHSTGRKVEKSFRTYVNVKLSMNSLCSSFTICMTLILLYIAAVT